jgi:hypothetical protein
MKVYIAGVPGGGWRKREKELSNLWRFRLWSYHYLTQEKQIIKMENKKVELFLDSGAFSAWTQGVPVDIREYIKFIKENANVIDVYANLDVIGIGGKKPNRLTAEKTLENQKVMEKAGLSPIPVFHFGEPFSFLEYYCSEYDYVALGVAGNIGTKLIPWLDTCFSEYICDKETGLPKIKAHGFAVTSLSLMLRYPWYSVDSTSWVVTGRMGGIFVPRKIDGEWKYDKNPLKVSVSLRSPNMKDESKHINTFSFTEREIILEYIHKKGYKLGKSKFKEVDWDYSLEENERFFGKKPENKSEKRVVEEILEDGISNRYQLRDELNIKYFLDLEESMSKWPWPFKRETRKKFKL